MVAGWWLGCGRRLRVWWLGRRWRLCAGRGGARVLAGSLAVGGVVVTRSVRCGGRGCWRVLARLPGWCPMG